MFYAAITLEDKLGSAYEPCIFAALNSAKVMLAIGTRPEYFNAVWVKNEWSRYLKLMKQDRSKMLIPCYRDMDAYELPEEFSHLQAQDMSKIGFINDIVRGIKKVLGKDEPQPAAAPVVVNTANAAVDPLLKRAFMFLEDGQWASADEYCEKVLDQDPENAKAYLGKVFAQLKLKNKDAIMTLKDEAEDPKKVFGKLTLESYPFSQKLEVIKSIRVTAGIDLAEAKAKADALPATFKCSKAMAEHFKQIGAKCDFRMDSASYMTSTVESFEDNPNYKKFLRYASEQDKAEIQGLLKDVKDKNNLAANTDTYNQALSRMNLAKTDVDFNAAADLFSKIPGFKDADDLAAQCRQSAEETRLATVYKKAKELMAYDNSTSYTEAMELFGQIKGYQDADDLAAQCPALLEAATKREVYQYAYDLMNSGKYTKAYEQFLKVPGYEDADKYAAEVKAKLDAREAAAAKKAERDKKYVAYLKQYPILNEEKPTLKKKAELLQELEKAENDKSTSKVEKFMLVLFIAGVAEAVFGFALDVAFTAVVGIIVGLLFGAIYFALKNAGKKKIDCACGYVINVKTDKLTSKVCPHCGNNVVFDQSKGEDAQCPVCHEKINTRESMASLVEFTCPSCACKLSADKNASTYVCPLCDTQIDVQERIAKEKIKDQGLASVIKYEGGNDVFVWKHPIEDFNLGSQLIVHESQEAIFFRDGKALDLFGAGRYTLATQNLPLLENLYKLPTNVDEVFHSEVYFVNMVTQMGIKWGTDSKVRMFDPASGLHVEIGACGNFNLRVSDSRKLVLKLEGTASEFKQSEVNGVEAYGITFITGKFKALIMSKVKANLARAVKENNINILEIDEYIDVLSEKLRVIINETLEEYGLTMPEFYVTSVLTPDDDPNFRRLKQQFADRTLKVREEEIRKAEAEAAQSRKILEAQTEAQLKMVGAQGEAEALKIKAQAEAEAYKAQAYAEAEEMRAKGCYTYQQETARQVGMEAMKNGITGGSGGASPLGDVVGLGVSLGAMGGVIGMTKEALNPIMENSAAIGGAVSQAAADTWDCPACGEKGITSKFCPQCGGVKPAPKETWDCPVCGTKGITSKFCPECGGAKPAPKETWDCPACGAKGITSKFCPECGSPKPAPKETWDCPACGAKNITSKFCPECGKPKPEAKTTWDCSCGCKDISSKFCPECGKGKDE